MRCERADSFLSRGIGLLGRGGLPAGEGLLITRTSSITMLLMRFAIDVVFLDKGSRVVKVAAQMKPFRVAVAFGGAHSALELPAGAATRARVERGDQLLVVDGQES